MADFTKSIGISSDSLIRKTRLEFAAIPEEISHQAVKRLTERIGHGLMLGLINQRRLAWIGN